MKLRLQKHKILSLDEFTSAIIKEFPSKKLHSQVMNTFCGTGTRALFVLLYLLSVGLPCSFYHV
jgi:hypothetical protein